MSLSWPLIINFLREPPISISASISNTFLNHWTWSNGFSKEHHVQWINGWYFVVVESCPLQKTLRISLRKHVYQDVHVTLQTKSNCCLLCSVILHTAKSGSSAWNFGLKYQHHSGFNWQTQVTTWPLRSAGHTSAILKWKPDVRKNKWNSLWWMYKCKLFTSRYRLLRYFDHHYLCAYTETWYSVAPSQLPLVNA